MNKFVRIIATFAALLSLLITGVYAQTRGTPSLKIVTPQEGQTVYGNKVPVLISAENFTIVDFQTNKQIVPNEGHVHLWLDDANPTRESAVKLTSESFTYSDVPYGNHKLVAELVTGDHASLNPPQTVTVNFKNEPITTPSPVTQTGFDKKTALVILVVVALVILAAWWYTKDEDEEEPKSKKTTKRKTAVKRRK